MFPVVIVTISLSAIREALIPPIINLIQFTIRSSTA